MDPQRRCASPARRCAPPTAWSSPANIAAPRASLTTRSRSRAREAIKDIGYEQDGFHWKHAKVEILLHSQSADIAQGVDAAEQEGRGRGRPGHHVRLCLRRNAGADAGADLLRAPHPAGALRCPPLRQGEGARTRRQEPGDGPVQERQAGRRHADRRVASAYR